MGGGGGGGDGVGGGGGEGACPGGNGGGGDGENIPQIHGSSYEQVEVEVSSGVILGKPLEPIITTVQPGAEFEDGDWQLLAPCDKERSFAALKHSLHVTIVR